MDCKLKEITVDGVMYVKKEQPKGEYKIIRTYSAGVFFAIVESRDGMEAVLRNAIRLWAWSGAASLSQLAMEGVKNPDACKFAMPVDTITVTQAIEILDCTKEAQDQILEMKKWKIN